MGKENTKLIFISTDKESELQVFANNQNELYIEIDSGNNVKFTTLDRPTAIKLSKELRKQISYLED